MTTNVNEKMKENLLFLCKQIAGTRKITAACITRPEMYGYNRNGGNLEVLLIIKNFLPRLFTYVKPLNKTNVFILAADQGVFERDINQGWLGEFVAEGITFPYEPLIGKEHLKKREIKVKKRIICELLENIVLEFPELSRELHIKPEYFMYETMMRRARLFPPITYRFFYMMRENVRERNIKSMMEGYWKALEELTREKKIILSNGYVKLSEDFIIATKKQKIRLPNFFRLIQKAFFLYILRVLPKMVNLLFQDQEAFAKSYGKIETEELLLRMEEPKNYVLMPTSLGLVPLTDKTKMEDFAKNFFSDKTAVDVEVKKLGGVLNSIYLLTFKINNKEERVVAKKFKDWLGFKWFPLALWTLGTRSFAVLGKSRLEREYVMNQLLQNQGFTVPTILHTSIEEGVIFEEFVKGENLADIIKRIIKSKKKPEAELDLIKEVGREIAKIHGLNITLGDCKPENIIVTKNRKICFVDLEQASKDGNQAWDIAEFLYYSGHYLPPIAPPDSATVIATSFIKGYLEAGGKKEVVRKAASPRYTKVFGIFTSPRVILAVSNICKKMGN